MIVAVCLFFASAHDGSYGQTEKGADSEVLGEEGHYQLGVRRVPQRLDGLVELGYRHVLLLVDQRDGLAGADQCGHERAVVEKAEVDELDGGEDETGVEKHVPQIHVGPPEGDNSVQRVVSECLEPLAHQERRGHGQHGAPRRRREKQHGHEAGGPEQRQENAVYAGERRELQYNISEYHIYYNRCS